MKIKTWIVALVALSIASSGCRTQRGLIGENSSVKPETKLSARQAEQALAEGRFAIESEEFYFPNEEIPLKFSSESHLSVKGNQAVAYIPWEVFRKSSFVNHGTFEYTAELTSQTPAKNGDARFRLGLYRGNKCMYRIPITLYRGTNRCFLEIYREYTGEHIADVKGFVRPLKE